MSDGGAPLPFLDFVLFIRGAGVPVAPAQITTLQRVLGRYDGTDVEALRVILKGILCRDGADAAIFDIQFDSYFEVQRARSTSLAPKVEAAPIVTPRRLKGRGLLLIAAALIATAATAAFLWPHDPVPVSPPPVPSGWTRPPCAAPAVPSATRSVELAPFGLLGAALFMLIFSAAWPRRSRPRPVDAAQDGYPQGRWPLGELVPSLGVDRLIDALGVVRPRFDVGRAVAAALEAPGVFVGVGAPAARAISVAVLIDHRDPIWLPWWEALAAALRDRGAHVSRWTRTAEGLVDGEGAQCSEQDFYGAVAYRPVLVLSARDDHRFPGLYRIVRIDPDPEAPPTGGPLPSQPLSVDGLAAAGDWLGRGGVPQARRPIARLRLPEDAARYHWLRRRLPTTPSTVLLAILRTVDPTLSRAVLTAPDTQAQPGFSEHDRASLAKALQADPGFSTEAVRRLMAPDRAASRRRAPVPRLWALCLSAPLLTAAGLILLSPPPSALERIALSARTVGPTTELLASSTGDTATLYENGVALGRWGELASAGLLMLPRIDACYQLVDDGGPRRVISAAVASKAPECVADWCEKVTEGPCRTRCLAAAKETCAPWRPYRADTGLFEGDAAPFKAIAGDGAFTRSALKRRFVVERLRRKTSDTLLIGDREVAAGEIDAQGFEAVGCAVEARLSACACPPPGCPDTPQRCEAEGYVIDEPRLY